MCVLNCVWLFATPWTVAHQTPLSMEFSRQEYWSRLPFPSPGDLSNLVLNWSLLCHLHRQVDSLALATPGGKCCQIQRCEHTKQYILESRCIHVGVYTFMGSHSMFSEIHQICSDVSMPRSTLIHTIYPSVINKCYRHLTQFPQQAYEIGTRLSTLSEDITEALRGHLTPES